MSESCRSESSYRGKGGRSSKECDPDSHEPGQTVFHSFPLERRAPSAACASQVQRELQSILTFAEEEDTAPDANLRSRKASTGDFPHHGKRENALQWQVSCRLPMERARTLSNPPIEVGSSQDWHLAGLLTRASLRRNAFPRSLSVAGLSSQFILSALTATG